MIWFLLFFGLVLGAVGEWMRVRRGGGAGPGLGRAEL